MSPRIAAMPNVFASRSEPLPRARWARLALAATAMAMAPSAWAQTAEALAPDPQLLGCWRAERVEQTFADGSVWTDVGGCTLEFTSARIVSACALRPGNQPVVYDYALAAPGRYLARIVSHPAQPAAVGSERHYDYRVEGDRLLITTDPQAAFPAPLSRAVRVLSVSVRVGSAADVPKPDGREQAGCQGRLTWRQTKPLITTPARVKIGG